MRGALRIPVIALITVASLQAYVAARGHLTPWKGGGFGMFSVTDGGSNRTVIGRGVTRAGDSVNLSLSGLVTSRELTRLKVAPTAGSLRKVASAALSAWWSPRSGPDVRRDMWYMTDDPDGATLAEAWFAVYRIRYDAQTAMIGRDVLVDIRIRH
jgi:hypothetical protein